MAYVQHNKNHKLTQPPQGSSRAHHCQRWIYAHSPLVHSAVDFKSGDQVRQVTSLSCFVTSRRALHLEFTESALTLLRRAAGILNFKFRACVHDAP